MSSRPLANNVPACAETAEAGPERLALSPGVADTGPSTGPGQAATPPLAPPPEAALACGRLRSLVGQTFDGLELLEEVGRGGMGVVYKARQKSLDRLVAVKLLLGERFVDSVRLARFQAEARAAARLDHPNIVQVYQVGECAAGYYFTMEYIDGRSLDDLIRRKKISPASAAALLTLLAEAVHYAHLKGIVHRDLKPANVMVDRSHRPVIMDFGIAKFLGASSALTQEGIVVGTPAYMAPEQAAQAPDKVGPPSDVYALGAILYTLLTGRPPYEAETSVATLLKVIGGNPPPPVRSLRPEVPQELEQICLKCLGKEPAARPASARALAESLRRFLARADKPTATLPRPPAQSTLKAVLPPVLLVAEATGEEIPLHRSRTVLGRSAACDVILRAAAVSKRHCLIRIGRRGVAVKDLGSANGTYVNGQPIAQARLRTGDRLRLADFEFFVRRAEPKAE